MPAESSGWAGPGDQDDPSRGPGGEPDERVPRGGRKSMVIRDWERPIFVAALIAILVLGGIAGLNSLMSLIP